MRMVFICQVVDMNDPLMAGTIRWIEAFASKPQIEHIKVIALRKGELTLPQNVAVCSIRTKSRLATLCRFYMTIFMALLKGADFFFIYQGGPYPALLLPFKIVLNKPVFQWKAHPYVGPMMRFYARFCDTRVFTSTRNAFPLDLPNIRIVGQGIDTSKFRIKNIAKTGDLVSVGRISPIKHIDKMIKTIGYCRQKYRVQYRLDIYGPVYQKDKCYMKHINSLIDRLGLKNCIFLHGPICYEELPDILNNYRCLLNFSETALDRSVVEAMACGLPVISTNPCVEEILPEGLKSLMIVPKDNIKAQADKIHQLMCMRHDELLALGQTLSELMKKNHSIDSLIDRILGEIVICV